MCSFNTPFTGMLITFILVFTEALTHVQISEHRVECGQYFSVQSTPMFFDRFRLDSAFSYLAFIQILINIELTDKHLYPHERDSSIIHFKEHLTYNQIVMHQTRTEVRELSNQFRQCSLFRQLSDRFGLF
jgi:hypothetical protein